LSPNIPVIYNDTGVEFPETRRFVRSIAAQWNLNLIVAKPARGHSFWSVCEKDGWPILGKAKAMAVEKARRSDHLREKLSKSELVLAEEGVHVSTRCCLFLKEKPTKKVELDLAADVKLLGMVAAESRHRMFLWVDYGDYYYVKNHFGRGKGIWKAHPLSIWTEADIWAYHEEFGVPHCELYDMGHDRNGCWPCAMGATRGQLGRLRRSHPKLFKYLVTKTGMGRELMRVKLLLGSNREEREAVEDWTGMFDIQTFLAQRPCFFDKL